MALQSTCCLAFRGEHGPRPQACPLTAACPQRRPRRPVTWPSQCFPVRACHEAPWPCAWRGAVGSVLRPKPRGSCVTTRFSAAPGRTQLLTPSSGLRCVSCAPATVPRQRGETLVLRRSGADWGDRTVSPGRPLPRAHGMAVGGGAGQGPACRLRGPGALSPLLEAGGPCRRGRCVSGVRCPELPWADGVSGALERSRRARARPLWAEESGRCVLPAVSAARGPRETSGRCEPLPTEGPAAHPLEPREAQPRRLLIPRRRRKGHFSTPFCFQQGLFSC